MRKRMIAKWVGKDANTGMPIRVGDEIVYDTETRKAYHDDREHGDDNLKIDGKPLLTLKEKV
jgi:hypothetical protein